MSERADFEQGSRFEESPSGLDINPRPPRPARVSRRAAGVVIVVALIILALFAYGGYKRQQRQLAALAERGSLRSVAPATAAGAEIANAVPTGARSAPPLADGKLVPPGEIKAPKAASRSLAGTSPAATAASPPPATASREPTLEERRSIAAYEAEQQAMTAPTTLRGASATHLPSLTSSPPVVNTRAATAGAAGDLGALLQSLAADATRARSERGLRTDTPDSTSEEASQRDKDEFLVRARAGRPSSYLNATRIAPLSEYEIKAGWEIPAVLEQGLNSDLPGELKALVASNVYDTATGRHLLIPQGSRLIGVYDSRVAYGQEGAQVVWNRVIYPDGSSLDLGGMVGQDTSGAAGFRGKVDRHYPRLVGFAVLTSLFAAASDLAQSRNRTVLTYPSGGEVAAAAVGREVSAVGAQVTRRNLSVQPTIRVPVGYRFNVRVNRDILFDRPYAPVVGDQ